MNARAGASSRTATSGVSVGFPMAALISAELADALERMNPWWRGRPGVVQPPHRRHLVAQIRRRLDQKLAPIVVVRGPRQIGKTTAQLQLISDLLEEGVRPQRILRVQFDELESEPELMDGNNAESDSAQCVTPPTPSVQSSG